MKWCISFWCRMLRYCFNILGKVTKAADGVAVLFKEKGDENKTDSLGNLIGEITINTLEQKLDQVWENSPQAAPFLAGIYHSKSKMSLPVSWLSKREPLLWLK